MMGLNELKEAATPIFLKYPIDKVSVFGSCARDQMNENSDIDILVNFYSAVGMFKFIEIKQELEEKLHHKIDLITYNALEDSEIRDEVMMEAVSIYEKRS